MTTAQSQTKTLNYYLNMTTGRCCEFGTPTIEISPKNDPVSQAAWENYYSRTGWRITPCKVGIDPNGICEWINNYRRIFDEFQNG